MHFAFVTRMLRLGTDQCIVQTLVVALAMVMRHQFSSRFPHRALPEQDHPLQTRLLNRPYRSACAEQRFADFSLLAPKAPTRSRSGQESELSFWTLRGPGADPLQIYADRFSRHYAQANTFR
jgi:hypothetical protein